MFRRFLSTFGKSSSVKTQSSPADLAQLQDAVVHSIVGDITDLHDGEWGAREWVHIAVNHEVLIEEGRRSSTQTAVLARIPGGELEDLSFRLGAGSKAKLLELRDAMSNDERTWTIVDLTIERNGHYAFNFSYEPPPRLNGNLLHSPLSGILDRYRTQNP